MPSLFSPILHSLEMSSSWVLTSQVFTWLHAQGCDHLLFMKSLWVKGQLIFFAAVRMKWFFWEIWGQDGWLYWYYGSKGIIMQKKFKWQNYTKKTKSGWPVSVSCFWYWITIMSDVTTWGSWIKGISLLSLQLPDNLWLFKNEKCFKNQAVIR